MDEMEELMAVHVPALVAVLLNKEQEKGSPLAEEEVIKIRDDAECIMMPADVIEKLSESRGYEDVNPECVWEHWQQARVELNESQ